jgi:hypothetical protein
MTQDRSAPSVLGKIEGFGKAAVAVLGVVYALGLVVVTLHLAQYGVSGLGLLREQYVLAGVWALFPLGAVVFILSVIVASIPEIEGPSKPSAPGSLAKAPGTGGEEPNKAAISISQRFGTFWTKFRRLASRLRSVATLAFGWILIPLFFLGFVSHYFSAGGASPFQLGELLRIALKVMGFCFAIAVLAFGGYWSLVRMSDYHHVFRGAVFCGTAMMAVLGYIGYFTASVYPRIPAAVGGGRPTRVQLLLKVDSSAESLSTVLYPGPNSLPPPLSTQHLLLFTTDATYIVIDPSNAQRTIEVSKDLIAAVRTR